MFLGMTDSQRKSMGRSVAGYTRVSRVGGRRGEGFISETDQQEGITSRARELGLTVADWIHDADYTGGNLQRPEWERLMARIMDPADPISGVIVVRVDRFARTVPEGAPEVKRIWESNGGAGIFLAADLPLDTTTPYGRKMLWDWLSNAELQLEMLKASWWRAKERAIRRGAHIGRTPLGMRRIPKNAESDAGRLVPLPEWREVITRMFDYAARHPAASVATIHRWAIEQNPRPDRRRWTHTTIGNLLRNRVYVGEVAYRPLPEGRRKTTDVFEPMVNPDAHEAIVDEATWLAAQRTGRRRPQRQQAPGHARRVYTLRGIVRCAGCRHTLVPSLGGGNARRPPTPVYRCDGESSAGRCPAPASIVAHFIEPWVLEQVKTQLGAFEAIGEFVGIEPTTDELFEAIEASRDDAHANVKAITQNTALAAADPDGWLAVRHAALEEARAADNAYLAAIRNRQASETPVLAPEFTWEDVAPEELRDVVLPEIIDCVYVRSGRGLAVDRRALILWRGQADPDLPGKGRPAPEVRSFAWPVDRVVP